MDTLIPESLTTSCKRCLRSFIVPNFGIMHLTSILLSLDKTASLFTISANEVPSIYGDISLAINKILFFVDIDVQKFGAKKKFETAAKVT